MTVLVVIAMQEEADGILDLLGSYSTIWEEDDGNVKRALYAKILEKKQIFVLVTGILEHNCVSLVSKVLREQEVKNLAIKHIVNFGCVGAVVKHNLRIGQWAYISTVHHYDVGSNVRAFCPSFSLTVPKGVKTITCATGSRFTKGDVHCFDCEDMELYGLASLASSWELSIVSLKYAANYCDENGERDFKNNVVKARTDANVELFRYLKELAKVT